MQLYLFVELYLLYCYISWLLYTLWQWHKTIYGIMVVICELVARIGLSMLLLLEVGPSLASE